MESHLTAVAFQDNNMDLQRNYPQKLERHSTGNMTCLIGREKERERERKKKNVTIKSERVLSQVIFILMEKTKTLKTESGEIEVSDAQASTFVHLMDLDPKLQVYLYQAILSPLRMMCCFSSYCEKESYPDGYSNRVAWLMQFGITFAKYTSPCVQLVAVVLISPILAGFTLLEKLVFQPVQAVILLLALVVFRCSKQKQVKY